MSHEPLSLCIEVLPHGQGLPLPAYATPGSAGLDLSAALEAPLVLAPGARALVATGLKLAIPVGHEGQVRPRSGTALKQGLTVLNAPGTIDSDYRGELKVLLVNLGSEPITLERGQRVAQLVIAPVTQARVVALASLDATARGAGGFGSSGA